jgi:Rps23 Pro-64 3,4-dihydroxylase Tpa1-like proline 4-hydroxylase
LCGQRWREDDADRGADRERRTSRDGDLVTGTAPQVRRAVISGREIFVCDNMVDSETVGRIGLLVKTLNYRRKEKSRPDVPGMASISEIAAGQMGNNRFLHQLRRITEEMLPGEKFTDQRAYVNSSLFGDSYYIHRDCPPDQSHVTALYYANLTWQPDWGGETIYYNEDYDAELVVSPRPGRVVVARGAILHRGNVPTRDCYEERLTLAYKLNALG